MLLEALLVEAQPRVGRNDMMVAEKPKVQNQDWQEQIRKEDNGVGRQDAQRHQTDDEEQIEAGSNEPLPLEHAVGRCMYCRHTLFPSRDTFALGAFANSIGKRVFALDPDILVCVIVNRTAMKTTLSKVL